MYVVQYELESRHPKVLKPVAKNCTASVNTYDMSRVVKVLERINRLRTKGF